jgi:hypothetical protein
MNWQTTAEFKQDAEFLWHCWWLPHGFLNLDYAKGVSVLLGWKEGYRKERYQFWNLHDIAEVSYEGGIAANPEIFELFQECGMAWKEDRADALQNLVLLLHQNIERHHLFPKYSRAEWIQKIVCHWQLLEAQNLVHCLAQTEALSASKFLLKLREAA